MIDKTSDEYGDYAYQEQKERRIQASEDNIKPCQLDACNGFVCTDGKHFSDKNKAVNHQYDIERGVA